MQSFYWKKFIVPYWPLVATALICFVIAGLAGLAAPLMIKFLIDGALANGDLGSLHAIAAGIVVLYFIRGLFSYLYGYIIAKAGNRMLAYMREGMFARLQSLDYAYFMNRSTGEIMSLFTTDLWLIQQAVTEGMPEILVESLNLVAIAAIMLYFDVELALVTFATVPFIILAIGGFNRKIARLGEMVVRTLDNVSGLLHQAILSVLIVQSYVREEYELRKFKVQIEQAAEKFLRAQRLSALLLALVEFLAAIGLTIIIWYGGREVIRGDLSIGGMFAFLAYSLNIPVPVRKISQAYTQLKLGTVAWQRIGRLDQQPATVPDGDRELPAIRGQVEFRDVSFEYQKGKQILRKIDLTAGPGEVVAIVGPSGAGKSSFANLLLRLYDPLAGAIFFDGVNVKELRLEFLRRQIGFIQQEPILFHTSILENIRYGRPDASMEQVETAAKMADAHKFIVNLSLGYQTQVSELGGNLSGGQRQRIAIARAILLDPVILLFDEPTASLDPQTEQLVMQSIRRVSAARTTFIITHRLSTIMASDKVVYLVNGAVVESGSHQDLMEQGGLYARAVALGELREGGRHV
ncbi:MAG TPA: ABC transporter ATP-binding protein [Patescibacteria group bacterium]|nr:ABC transporter ATP-binding protein [Patescibacteria group bacterium]